MVLASTNMPSVTIAAIMNPSQSGACPDLANRLAGLRRGTGGCVTRVCASAAALTSNVSLADRLGRRIRMRRSRRADVPGTGENTLHLYDLTEVVLEAV